ncbi:MAG: sigma 54-interacting transcriptional regulator [Sandaracinus sp.]
MEAIVLSFRGEPVRVFALEDRPLEVGSAAGCDIVVHDVRVPERYLLVRRRGVDVVAHRLDDDEGPPVPVRLSPDRSLEVGETHAITLVLDAITGARDALGRTEPVLVASAEAERVSVIVGRGADARRLPLHARPVTIGAHRGLDLTLYDRAVSGRHARIEPSEGGWLIRDLGSRNGTYVDGVATLLARIGPGTRIRLGRTDLFVVATGERGDARDGGMVAASPAMIDVLETIERYAKLPWPVLVAGETGAGKEGLARAVHQRSARRERPFVTLNAAELSESLVESELFGHEKGAFTGAHTQHRGVFEQADHGTLFLDEIGELALGMQARLLRVLETGEIRRVGSELVSRVDVRLVCATHRDLAAMVQAGRFREDLYYRIARLPVEVPPLRDRPEDIAPLAYHFLESAREILGARAITEAALSKLRAHPWPGNVRELRNTVEAAAARTGGTIDLADVEAVLGAGRRPSAPPDSPAGIALVLKKHAYNQTQAAKELGLPRSTLRDRLARAKRLGGT